ncbi:hypothetical protein RirG_006490 [Rhizophagus irregularis DAOM 197198w]|uniref:Uncharacterized protein n=1 Tax=Rhizophagus irregularis (strain DAOM 197198w) TaxID=1432141 RepID=A0A015KC37_RHIIW|nr:hypothetical protein RirG_142210 [Rhizophagus irregularis DAOM 197198w]EXX79347.1 hypothetical protein RirG_006490 [Rhizophagus irregularis DAOM 197198w]
MNEELDQESLNIQNSDTESELFNYYLQELLELFQENIINMVATSVEVETAIRRTLENALELPANALNNALGAEVNLAERIENAGNETGGIVSMPMFYGKEEEDVNDWVRQFEIAFTAIGKAAGNNGVRQAAFAATCLRGAAFTMV